MHTLLAAAGLSPASCTWRRARQAASAVTLRLAGVGKRSADTGPVLREAVRRLLVDELHLLPARAGSCASAAPAAAPPAAGPRAPVQAPVARSAHVGRAAMGSTASPGQGRRLAQGPPDAAAACAEGSAERAAAGSSEGRPQGSAKPGASEVRPLRYQASAGAARRSRLSGYRSVWRGGDNPGRIILSQAELARWLARHAAHDSRRNPAP